MQLTEPVNKLRKPKRHLVIASLKITHGHDFKMQIILDLPPDDNETKKLTSTYKERPKPSFYDALNIILETLITRLRLDREWWQDGKVTGINLKETDDGINAKITASLELSEDAKSTVVFEEKNISYELKEELDNLAAEIEDYVAGDRSNNHKQMQLFEE